MPFVLDALIEGSSREVQQFAVTMDWMFAARTRHGRNGSLSRLVVENDRAPLACYLADGKTTSKSRSAVLKLLREIWKEFSGISSRISELSKLYIL